MTRKPEPESLLDSRAQALVEAHRRHGYRLAALDPLDLAPRVAPRDLDPRYHRLVSNEPQRPPTTDFEGPGRDGSLPDLLEGLRTVYCGPLAVDCEHLRDPVRQRWLWRRMERRPDPAQVSPGERRRTLELLLSAEAWEGRLSAAHPKQKRFSLEGCESLIAVLDRLVHRAGARDVRDVVMGMAHRGRLNVLINVLGMAPRELLAHFSPAYEPLRRARDLKYHLGHTADLTTSHGPVRVRLAYNPSHLESISPVVCGMARALQDGRGDDRRRVLPVLVHGDAAVCGQGVVMETLNLSQTRGYGCGGTVHVVLNNQVGFTTSEPADARSMAYCTDVARLIDAPVIHVNADDPDLAVLAAELAVDYRAAFGADVFIDLVGFRRHGHNEQDITALTQPEMHRRIAAHPGVVTLYSQQLLRDGHLSAPELHAMRERAAARLTDGAGEEEEPELPAAPASTPASGARVTLCPSWPRLRKLALALATVPHDLLVHGDVRRLVEGWTRAVQDADRPVDWPMAENLAYALVLTEGGAVRVSGMDVGRGTFFHRHARWLDQQPRGRGEAARAHLPLRHLGDGQGRFDVFDSPLSEEGVLGFEYGYSVVAGPGLVVWEAQYGDFVNNAQVALDQYISTGEAKWGYRSGLVLLLPHGHEGIGPEHSCAYLGRFLALCAGDNMRVVVPSTSAQLFHLLLEQAEASPRRPLVVLTPKTELHGRALSCSPAGLLATGRFEPLLADATIEDPARVRRAVVCAGKVYYDLLEAGQPARDSIALLRVEQLHPFPTERLAQELRRFNHLEEVVWVQEEAKNHGAWHLIREPLEAALPPGTALRYAGRPAAAPSATSDRMQHLAEQREIAEVAMSVDFARNSARTWRLPI